VIFSGVIKTTDGKKWSVGFEALSWEDAQSLAEDLGVNDLGISLGTTPATHDDPPDLSNMDKYQLDPPESHFCAWHYRDGEFVNDD